MVFSGFEPGTAEVGTDESTELWRPPENIIILLGI